MTYTLRLPPSLDRALAKVGSVAAESPVVPVQAKVGTATPRPSPSSSRTVTRNAAISPSLPLPVVPVPKYELVTARERAAEISAALSTESRIAVDIETFAAPLSAGADAALDCTRNRVRLVQLATRGRTVAIFDLLALGGLPACVGRLLSSEEIEKVGFNIRFDARNLLHHFGAEVHKPVDLLAGAVLAHGYQDHQTKGAHTLQRLVERYLSQILPKDQAASDWGTVSLTGEQLDYAARDAMVLLPLHDEIRAATERRGVSAAWQLENNCIPAVVSMEEAGIDVDRGRLERLVTSWRSDADTAALDVTRELGAINLNSPRQIVAAVKARYGIVLTSTAESTITEHAASAPAVQSILTHRRAKKRIDAAEIFISAVQPDGRVRARFNPLAAPTGRFGCSAPNLLAVPRDPEFRGCFIAGPGKKLVIADYAAIQLRIIADLTLDPEMIRCFASNPPIDPHRRTAAFITGKSMEEVGKEERQLAKAVNFGLAFGMGARTFVKYALSDYGVVLTVHEADLFRNRFLTLYRGIRDWHRRTAVEGPGREGARTGSGRFRRLVPKNGSFPFTHFLATPVQGTEADGVKRALALLHQRLASTGADLVNVVHDEIVVRAPADTAGDVRVIVVQSMIEGMQEFVTRVPVVVEAVVSDSWVKS